MLCPFMSFVFEPRVCVLAEDVFKVAWGFLGEVFGFLDSRRAN